MGGDEAIPVHRKVKAPGALHFFCRKQCPHPLQLIHGKIQANPPDIHLMGL
jgi:hypothetical protein